MSKHHDKDSLVIKYKREFEVALIKICLVSGGIGFAAGNITGAILTVLAR